ncbi:cyclopropane-fatty-acyl-phospholipid synthase [Streptomyces cirratus]|uniref:Cyclopropane-fatty-acyl-phospholipid synthase n=1 Tax=Streptomyces cirratus TaxID=68187 RepID=A0ABQ3F388_9ACTN|nr:cyclopropane-fatty-acyl-phospholipid synthase family protein [Streptomyces cirratus]GHB67875.1 cyclopropane-fatty-acyl-phospholipid synthase [Streptomyces cirratus]
MRTAAGKLTELMSHFLTGPLPVQVRAWDGSRAGPTDAPLIVVRSPRALRRLLWQPGELGLAEAYITGDLDVDGDLAQALSQAGQAVRDQPPTRPRPAALAAAAVLAARLGASGPPPARPEGRARLSGRLHSATRDRAAISHHYDVPAHFYALLLDPSMAYSCAYWTRPADASYGLAEAQHDKLELICRKLGLGAGDRLLDVGCGWGSLAVHAARTHKAHVTAVTLSRSQRDHVIERCRREGVADRVHVQLRHWRHIDGAGYDAVTAVEMGEHVGHAEYPYFAEKLRGALRPEGRLLIQQMSRGAHAPGGGAFIETYIAPDMHMRPLGQTTDLLETAGLEVRSVQSLREHYTATIDAWRTNLEDHWSQVEDCVGETTGRVWRLYLAGASLAFTERRMGVDQILAVRPSREGRSAMPATPVAWYAPAGRS